MLEKMESLRSNGFSIVFANGVFDLLHEGHRHLLSVGKTFGDVLVVGINSDSSVRRLKGSSRPVQQLELRRQALLKIPEVNFVVPFEEDTPLELIRMIRPSIIVKGDDYSPSEVVGGEFVKSYGGRVVVVKRLPGLSTTSIISGQHGADRSI